jgi:hypothetical protein
MISAWDQMLFERFNLPIPYSNISLLVSAFSAHSYELLVYVYGANLLEESINTVNKNADYISF